MSGASTQRSARKTVASEGVEVSFFQVGESRFELLQPTTPESPIAGFLEKRGEVHTAVELREKMKAIDLDSNNRLCFIEYALFRYEKTLEELFTAREKGAPPAELLKASTRLCTHACAL